MYLCYSTTSFPCFIALTVGCYLSFGLLSYSCRMLTVHIMCQPNAMFQHVVAPTTVPSEASARTIQTARSAFFFCLWMALVGELPVYLGVFFSRSLAQTIVVVIACNWLAAAAVGELLRICLHHVSVSSQSQRVYLCAAQQKDAF